MKHLIYLGVAAVLVCALTVLAMTGTGLKDYRESLRGPVKIYAQKSLQSPAK